jgi:anaerobic nitric oxide reductase transcription regulator
MWLSQYAWPGNVRELEHTLSRAMIRALSYATRRDRVIELTTQHLGTDGEPMRPLDEVDVLEVARAERPLNEVMEQVRREVVQARLRAHANNRTAAARSLGLDRGNFHRLLKRLGLND